MLEAIRSQCDRPECGQSDPKTEREKGRRPEIPWYRTRPGPGLSLLSIVLWYCHCDRKEWGGQWTRGKAGAGKRAVGMPAPGAEAVGRNGAGKKVMVASVPIPKWGNAPVTADGRVPVRGLRGGHPGAHLVRCRAGANGTSSNTSTATSGRFLTTSNSRLTPGPGPTQGDPDSNTSRTGITWSSRLVGCPWSRSRTSHSTGWICITTQRGAARDP